MTDRIYLNYSLDTSHFYSFLVSISSSISYFKGFQCLLLRCTYNTCISYLYNATLRTHGFSSCVSTVDIHSQIGCGYVCLFLFRKVLFACDVLLFISMYTHMYLIHSHHIPRGTLWIVIGKKYCITDHFIW